MRDSAIPDDVKRLLAERITSVEQLEMLLLLRGQPERAWTAAELSDELRSHPSSVAEQLDELLAQGFVRMIEGSPARYRYSPPNGVGTTVDRLARAYAERRYRVIELIFSKPIEKLKVFADAFRLRKGEGDG